MKYTLLEMTQLILSSMDSDEVTSISDTTEATQVANVIRTAYYDLVGQAHLPEDYALYNLDATGSTTPTAMSLPTEFDSLKWLKYNVEDTDNPDQNWQLLTPLSLEDFQRRMYLLNESETNVSTYNLTVGGSTIPILYVDDKMPQYYTTIDDRTVIFDSIDTDEETFLASLKTQGFGREAKTFTLSDDFTPDLDEDQFALLLQESKSLAWAELKQTMHQKAEQSARRHKISQQINKKAIKIYKAFDELPNFGRK